MKFNTQSPEIEKMPTGIDGFDEISGGGLPRDRTTVVFGRPGAGKTILAMEVLVHGVQAGEPGIFVSFEEPKDTLAANMASLGWDIEGPEGTSIDFIDARLFPQTFTSGDFDVEGLLASIEARAQEVGARRIVFDSLDTMLSLLRDPIAQRRELYRILDWARRARLTAIITVRQSTDDPFTPDQFEFLQFMSNCALTMNYRIEKGISNRSLRILKYRGSGFAENEFPLLISDRGIEVASLGSDILGGFDYPSSDERLSCGMGDLDEMIGGGYFRGSSTLVTGHPGSGKSTLCSLFLDAACGRGERSLYISFDESADEIARNMKSLGIDLQAHLESGCLRMKSIRSEAHSAETYLLLIKRIIEEHEPACMVIDPLSAILKGQDEQAVTQLSQRLLHLTKRKQITIMCSSLLERGHAREVGTPLEVSTVADTWLHLEQVVRSGQRNRTLTVIKSRGTAHSNLVREVLFSGEGVSLAEQCTVNGEMLMGRQREAAEKRGDGAPEGGAR